MYLSVSFSLIISKYQLKPLKVAQAKAEHFRAFNVASLRAAAEPENESAPQQITQITAAAAPASVAQPQLLAVRTSEAPNAFSYSFNTPTFYNGPQLIAARSLPFAIQLNNNNNQNTNNNNLNNVLQGNRCEMRTKCEIHLIELEKHHTTLKY